MKYSLKDEITLVTGASRGIGRSIATAIGEQGALVVGTATSEEGAEHITAELKAASIAGIGLMLDVTQPDAILRNVKRIEKEYGSISILVNNAGITQDSLLLRMKEEDWDTIIETNLKSVFRLTKACLRGMTRRRRGRVINITSVIGATGNSGQSNYAASKAGVVGFTKSLALEVASRGITVNAIAPGYIETDMTATLDQARKDQLESAIPIRRLGRASDIATAAVFLASSEAGYITGQVLHVNGGMFMSS